MKKLPRSTPEDHGIPSERIQDFLEHISLKELELHSFMLLKDGFVVSEGWWHPYKPVLPHMLFSLSKSFTSTAIGFAVSEGLLTVDDLVLSFFQGDAPKDPSQNLSSMKVKHLLSMSTGHAEDTTGKITENKEGNWAKGFLELPVEFTPGTHFLYNSGASYMLSAIIQKLTGETVLDYLSPRLFKPLGIENPTWETCPMGINTGGWGLSIKTEDIAKFGQLYLQEGIWEERQVLASKWIQEATQFHISNGNSSDSDWSQGYGYQFWRCRNNAYRGDGAFGQYCIVMPEKNVVIAITSGLDDMQAVLNLIWEDLLPSMGKNAILENKESYEKLQQTLNELSLLPPSEKDTSLLIPNISSRYYEFEDNHIGMKGITFEFSPNLNQVILNIGNSQEQLSINCGVGQWVENEKETLGLPGEMLASSTWVNDNTFRATVRFIETPFYETFNCAFNGESVQINSSMNVSFGTKDRLSIQGRIIK